MTQQVREAIDKIIWNHNHGKKYGELSADDQRVLRENNCRSMIDSILAYTDWTDDLCPEVVMQREENNYYNYLAKYVNGDEYYRGLGRTRVLELIAEQIADIDHIETDTYTDSEGLSYNTIIWKER